MRFEEFGEGWFAEAAIRTRASSLRRYRTVYQLQLLPAFEGRELESIERWELKATVAGVHARGLGIRMTVRVLSMLFRGAYDDGLVTKNPALELGRAYRAPRASKVKAFTAAELARLLEELETEPAPYRGLFRTMAYSGLRSGEARALRVSDVSRRRLAVERTFSGDELSPAPKTGPARLVEIPESLGLELERRYVRFRSSEEWLFESGGEFLRQTQVWRRCKATLRRAGLSERFSPHSLRHTYASLLIQQGASLAYVQRQLGHSSIQLTVDCYGRWLELSDVAALDRLVRTVGKEHRPAVVPFRRSVGRECIVPFPPDDDKSSGGKAS